MAKTVFSVVGAGEFHIGDNCECICGRVVGFEFLVSWGRHGLAGGVLSRHEARQLIEYLTKKLEGITESDEEAYERISKQVFGKL